jgi:hypothetical protein
MRYVKTNDMKQANRVTRGAFDACGNISVTGSVRGMQSRFGWPRGGQVRCGAYVYNIGPHAVAELRVASLLRGD